MPKLKSKLGFQVRNVTPVDGGHELDFYDFVWFVPLGTNFHFDDAGFFRCNTESSLELEHVRKSIYAS